MNKVAALGAFVLAVCVASASLQAADKVEIRQKLSPGTYLLTEIEKDSTVTTIAGQDQKANTTSTTVWELAVGQPDGKGLKKVAARVVRLAKSGTEDGKEVSYDTDKEVPADHAFVFKPLMAATATLTLDADDCIVECGGLDKLWESLVDKAAGDADKKLLAEFTLGTSDKIMEQNFRQIETMMPKNAVAKGQTWMASMRMELPMVGEIKTKFECSLADVTPDKAVIQASGTHETSKKKTFTLMGVTATLTKAAVQDSVRLEMDLRTGLAAKQEIRRTGEVTLVAKDGDKDVEVLIKPDLVTTITLAAKSSGQAPVIPGLETKVKPPPETTVKPVEPATKPVKPPDKPVIPGLE